MPTITLTPEHLQRIMRAIDEPSRYGMLREIYSTTELTCGAMTEALGLNAGTASHHLHILEEAELVSVTKAGRYKLLSPRRDVWKAYLSELKQL